jgi:hypothetical protein
MMSRCRLILSALALLLSSQLAHADDGYYLMVFGAQSTPKVIRRTHTFAAFVHARGQGTDPAAWSIVNVVTISWMPATLVIHPLDPRPEPGINLDLHSTFAWALRNEARISMWGPYAIGPELFDLAAARAEYLDSGMAREAILDRFRRPHVLDCIHALSGVDPSQGYFLTRFACGDMASYYDLHHFARFILEPCRTHDWVAEQLGVFCYPICRRGFCEVPHSLLPILPPRYRRWEPMLWAPRFREP